MEFTFDAELRIWAARRDDSWTFVSLPGAEPQEIRELTEGGPPRGSGSVRAQVTVGTSVWQTSVFPGAAKGCHVLPIKRAARRKQGAQPRRSGSYSR